MGFTDLLNSCREAGLEDPVVDDARSEFTVTIKRNHAADKKQIKKIKDSEIVLLLLENPTLSIEKLANKQQITVAALRTRINKFKDCGILKREGARKNGRWVFTSKFGGCAADGGILLKEQFEFDNDIVTRVQAYAEARGIPVSIAISELLGLGVNDPAFLKKLAHGNDALRKEA